MVSENKISPRILVICFYLWVMLKVIVCTEDDNIKERIQNEKLC
jgi:hypothetical protein